MLTLGKASSETGKSKTTIAHAIKSGRLSATINDKGQYQIDPAELFRVYAPSPSIRRSNRPSNLDTETAHLTHDKTHLERELELVKEQLEREREINKRLFDQLDDAHKERRQLTLLLEHFQEKSQPKQKSNGNDLWNRVFRGKNQVTTF